MITRMKELRGIVREGVEEIFNRPRKPAKLLLDDLNKIQVERTTCEVIDRYKSYPESHHLDRVDED